MPTGARFVAANLEQPDQAASACRGADAVVCAVGAPYDSRTYARVWPRVMSSLLAACARTQARLVIADNLYMYGPQAGPLREDTPLTNYGAKPRVRAEITGLWQEAHRAGRVRATSVRASDFYGPDTPTSVLSIFGVSRLLAGKAAFAPYPPDQPHDFTFVPDFARALETLIDAPDDAYGQAWHVPNAPTQSLRALLILAARLIGVRPRVMALPEALVPVVGLFNADVRALAEMRFQWERPYRVDTAKFERRFWSDPTSFEEGLRATIDYYRQTGPATHSSGG